MNEQEKMLNLIDEVDTMIIDLMFANQMHPTETIAFILARIVAISKQVNGEKDLLVLLEKMKSSIMDTPNTNTVLH